MPSKGHIWTAWVIFSGKKSIRKPYEPYISAGSPYMDRQRIYFWKKVHIWTVSQSISGRKSMYMNHQSIYFWKTVHIWTSRSIFESSLLSRTFGEKLFWEPVPGKMNMVTGNNLKTSNFLKMPPQAKPLCS